MGIEPISSEPESGILSIELRVLHEKTVQKYIKSFCLPNKMKKKALGQAKSTTNHSIIKQYENKMVVFISNITNNPYICSQFKNKT